MNSQELQNQHAVVTGASSGMGLGIAEMLASAGANVTLLGRSESKVKRETERLAGLGYAVQGRALDVRDAAAVAEAYAAAASTDGRLDIAVHAAGVVYPGSIAEADPEQWADVIGTNVLGVMYGSREALRRMQAGATIVNVSSTSGREPSKVAAYSASKHAVTGFTECLRREAAPLGVRVVCLEPGLVYSEFNRHMPEDFQQLRREVPSLTPGEVAEVLKRVITLPSHVDLGEIVLRPVSQVA
ncbi:MAG TPA: SDR family oxidoreductase [Trebonia sp.]|nr:SDR family oxidoreductase [Trebonia sp.]